MGSCRLPHEPLRSGVEKSWSWVGVDGLAPESASILGDSRADVTGDNERETMSVRDGGPSFELELSSLREGWEGEEGGVSMLTSLFVPCERLSTGSSADMI